MNGAAIRAMGFDFQVFYWSTFWISPPSSYYAPTPPYTSAPHTSNLMVRERECLDARLHRPAALRPCPHKRCQYQSASARLQPGGSDTHNRGCKTCLWGLLTVPSLGQLAGLALSHCTVLSLTGPSPDGFAVCL